MMSDDVLADGLARGLAPHGLAVVIDLDQRDKLGFILLGQPFDFAVLQHDDLGRLLLDDPVLGDPHAVV